MSCQAAGRGLRWRTAWRRSAVADRTGRWGEVFGDETVVAAAIDRLVHHAEVYSLKGESYRIRGRELGRVPTATHNN